MPESERIPVLFLFNLHKAPSLALFSCNGCATLGKGPKTALFISIQNLPYLEVHLSGEIIQPIG